MEHWNVVSNNTVLIVWYLRGFQQQGVTWDYQPDKTPRVLHGVNRRTHEIVGHMLQSNLKCYPVIIMIMIFSEENYEYTTVKSIQSSTETFWPPDVDHWIALHEVPSRGVYRDYKEDISVNISWNISRHFRLVDFSSITTWAWPLGGLW